MPMPTSMQRLAGEHRWNMEYLRKLGLPDNPAFHRLTRLVARTLNVPLVLLSLIDDDQQWFISHVGLPSDIIEQKSIPRRLTVCQHVVDDNSPLIISDPRNDMRLAQSPIVKHLGVAAYIGMPLRIEGDEAIGVLCAFDYYPRLWAQAEIDTLYDLSLAVATEAELSLKLIENEEVKEKLSHERDLLRTLIDSFPDYIFVKDRQGRFVISNKAHAEAAQISDPEQLVGKTAFDTFPPELAEQYDADDQAVIRSGAPLLNLERQTIDPNGKRKWVLTSKVPFLSRDGKMAGLVGISRDITARKQAEEALRDRERFIEQILMTSPGIVYVFDIKGQRSVFSNLENGNVLGYLPKELQEMGEALFPMLMHPDDLVRLPAHFERLMGFKDGDVAEFEYRMRNKDGQNLWFLSRDAVFIRDAQGRPEQIIGAAVDITERKRAEAALRESEQRLRMVINHAPVILFELDANGAFALSEGRGLRAFGIEPEADSGRNALDVFAHLPQIALRLERALNGETVGFIYDDEQVVYQMNFTPILDANGDVINVIGVGNDVTEQVRARDAVAASNARLKLLRDIDAQLTSTLELQRVLESAMHAAVDSSRASDGYVALLEDKALRIAVSFGRYTNATRLRTGKGHLADIIQSQQAVRVDSLKASKSGASALPSSKSQMIVPLTYGEHSIGVLTLEASHENAFDEDTFTFIKSLGARTAAAMENARLYELAQTQLVTLQELFDKVHSLEQLKTDMIRIAAHDLRNPLTAANGFLSMISDDSEGKLSQAQQNYLKDAVNSLRSIQKIITDILSLQRIEALSEQTNYQSVEMCDLVTSRYAENRALAENKRLSFQLTLPEDSIWVRGDNGQLREAIDNLIHNAIKYTPEGGEVHVRLFNRDDRVVFEVEDTGYGIPQQMQSKVFQPFFRAKTAQTRQIEGTGLGLHLVRNIIERHGGKMHFVSAVGKGSTFGFELSLLSDGR